MTAGNGLRNKCKRMGPKRTAPDDGSGDTDVKKAKSDSGEVRKGRGRPRILEESKKMEPYVPSGRGRGRPKKDKPPVSDSSDDDQEDEDEKPKEEAEESVDEVEKEEEEEEVKETKKTKKAAAAKPAEAGAKKRGRPRKQAAEDKNES